MYAVIKTGGKQYRVTEGQELQVEKLDVTEGEVTLTPVLLVDGDTVVSAPSELAGASVTANVVGAAKGITLETARDTDPVPLNRGAEQALNDLNAPE